MMSTPQQLGELLDVLDDDALREAFARPDAFERGETKEAMDAALVPVAPGADPGGGDGRGPAGRVAAWPA